MNPTLSADDIGTIAARPGGYVAVHHRGHSSHGPVPTVEDAARALTHMGRTGLWPEKAAA